MSETPSTTFFTSEAIDRIVEAGGGLPGSSKWDERSTEDRRRDLAVELDFIASEFVSSRVTEIRARTEGRAAPRRRGRPTEVAFKLAVEGLQGVWLSVFEKRFGVSRFRKANKDGKKSGGPQIRFLGAFCDELADHLRVGPEIFDEEHRKAVGSELRAVPADGLLHRVRKGRWRKTIGLFEAKEKRRRARIPPQS